MNLNEHPRITKFMIENNLYVSEEEHINYPGLFGYNGKDSNSFLLPDLRNLFIRGKNDNIENGQYQEDTIRNITGEFHSTWNVSNGFHSLQPSGCFIQGYPQSGRLQGTDSKNGTPYGVGFDASRVVPTAEENRPVNISYIPVIRY